jgi:excisionase family DNA binding protein
MGIVRIVKNGGIKMMDETVYTTFEVSRFCVVDISTVMTWVDEGKLKAYRTPGGHRRIRHGDFLSFLRKYGMPIHPHLKNTAQRVLIVDDDPLAVRTLKRVIEKMDPTIEIATASDGFAAGQQLELFSPHLILLDLMLPGIDGFQVCKNIRADERKKDMRIIAISALRGPGSEKRVLDNGADRFLRKPLDITVLREAIADLLDLEPQPTLVTKK